MQTLSVLSPGLLIAQAKHLAQHKLQNIPREVSVLPIGTVIALESPFGSQDRWIVEANVAYARAAVRWCLLRGLVPLASHLTYTQMLDDNVPAERAMGIEAGKVVEKLAAKATLVFCDRGVSKGVEYGIQRSVQDGRPVHCLCLPGWGK
jgi:hypothetical protein